MNELFLYISDLPTFIGYPEKNARAAIVFCHGFGGSKSEKSRHFVRLSKKLRQKGFLTVRFDFTGFGDSPKDTKEFSIAQGVRDIKNVIQHVINNHPIDIGILGYSLGALVVSKAISENIPVNAACLMAPLEHYKLSPDQQSSLKQNRSDVFLEKGLELSTDFLTELLNSKGAETITETDIPIQIIHGTLDQVVPDQHGKNYSSAIKNKSFRPVYIEGANHFFERKEDQKILDDTVTTFFKTVFGG